MAEERVLNYINGENRPFNVQLVADMLAQFGIKKPQVQRAVDALSEAGKITCKEFGKSKIYLPLQQDVEVLDKDEMDAKKTKIRELNEQIRESGERVRQIQKELQGLGTFLTLEELTEKDESLLQQIGPLKQKLAKLQSGSVLISKEEREGVEKGLQKYLDAWAQRRRIFKNIWGDISENVDQNQKEVFEEMGVQTDEDLEVSHEAFSKLQMKRRRI
ncbi:hypothetical protein ABBQ38_013599 [Trebouxia sp. C0009 RCD-2024]